MLAGWIWLTALVLYGVFSFWYNNWRGPLTPTEVDDYLTRLQAAPGTNPDVLGAARLFLEADDGREFFMVNLIRLHPNPVVMPGSGELQPARRVLAGYTNHFMPALFKRAGHPIFVGPAAGGYLEHWGVEPNPGWTFAGIIRYRSRRDVMELATDPTFDPSHAYKIAAMANTLAFPVTPAMTFFGPRVWMALTLLLLATLAHLMLSHR